MYTMDLSHKIGGFIGHLMEIILSSKLGGSFIISVLNILLYFLFCLIWLFLYFHLRVLLFAFVATKTYFYSDIFYSIIGGTTSQRQQIDSKYFWVILRKVYKVRFHVHIEIFFQQRIIIKNSCCYANKPLSKQS